MGELEAEWSGRDVADPANVEDLTARVRAVVTRKSLEAAVEVGRLLFERCHGADRAQVGRHATIDAIAAQPDAPMSRTALYRAVQIFLQWQEFPPDIRDELGASQHRALLGIPAENIEKIRLAREAAKTSMPTRELEHRARELLGRAPAPEPAETSPPAREGLQPLGSARRALQPWVAAIRAGRKLTPRERQTLREEVAAVRALLAELEAQVG